MKKKMLVASLCAVVILAVAIGIFWYYHPTHVNFNDRFILGNTEENIVERYGAFASIRRNEAGEITRGVYMIRDNTPEMIMGYDNSLWYEIYFKNGVAVSVRLQEGWYGG